MRGLGAAPCTPTGPGTRPTSPSSRRARGRRSRSATWASRCELCVVRSPGASRPWRGLSAAAAPWPSRRGRASTAWSPTTSRS
eukprot:2865043-Pyramimonas_sp.AAC.1